MKCPNCNSEIPDGFKFCTQCGHPLPTGSEASDTKTNGTPAQTENLQETTQTAGEPNGNDKPVPHKRPWLLRNLWWLAILFVFVVGAAVILIVSADKRPVSGDGFDNEPTDPTYDLKANYETSDSAGYYTPVATEETVADENADDSYYQSETARYYLEGDWKGYPVTLRLTLNRRGGESSVNVTGKAYYDNFGEFSLSGNGYIDDDRITLRLTESNSNEIETGTWSGSITASDGQLSYIGSFYENGNQVCTFHLTGYSE